MSLKNIMEMTLCNTIRCRYWSVPLVRFFLHCWAYEWRGAIKEISRTIEYTKSILAVISYNRNEDILHRKSVEIGFSKLFKSFNRSKYFIVGWIDPQRICRRNKEMNKREGVGLEARYRQKSGKGLKKMHWALNWMWP